MIASTFSISFDYVAEQESLTVHLIADVDIHHSSVYYIVRNFRIPEHAAKSILPDIQIKKIAGQWVHTDSRKQTHLSAAAGQAIDQWLKRAS